MSCLGVAACGDDVGGTQGASGASGVTGVSTGGSGVTASGEPTGGTTTGGSEGMSAGTSTSTDGASSAPTTGPTSPSTTTGFDPKLDVGVDRETETDSGGEPSKGCKKVDFLFVIDNSGSMADEQQSLIASFPGFISSIKSTLKEAQDYHIMVIDTDAWLFAGCNLTCAFPIPVCPAPDFACGDPPLECEDVIGAGVVHPRGTQSSSKDCGFASMARYMDQSEPDLASTFACAAKVGTGSVDDPERPMEAMVAAVAPTGPAHDCNAGFIREDAILVVTFITDEDDNWGDGSAGTPAGWKASLVAAKKGDESALVVLGLFGDNDQPNAVCGPFDPNSSSGAEPSPRLREFVNSFGDHGFAGSVCSNSYDSFFAQAVGLIDTTCEDFIPPM